MQTKGGVKMNGAETQIMKDACVRFIARHPDATPGSIVAISIWMINHQSELLDLAFDYSYERVQKGELV
jgi:hypothetical protein